MSRLVLGLDFGGTKVGAGIVDLQSMQIVDTAFCPTRAEAGAEGAVADILELSTKLENISKIEAIGVCFGGYAVKNQIIKSLHIAGWDHFPIHERLKARLGDVPIYVANDANAVALAEFKYGAGRGSHSMLFLTVSTGVGGGIILDGKLWEGPNGIAGEIGHMKAEPDSKSLCGCGRYGCLETVAAGPWMVKRAKTLMDRRPDMTSDLRGRDEFTARDLDQLAAQDDEIASQIVTESARHLGLVIGNTINLLDIDCVVIGGGVSRSGELWWKTVRAGVDETILPWRPTVELKPSALGTDEGIWGAAALLPDI
jgi:glucokinase